MMVETIKIHILRLLMAAAVWVWWRATRLPRLRWLLHYLQGSGTPLDLPAEEIAVIQGTLAGLWMDSNRHVWGTARSAGPRDEVQVLLGHSTLYEGRGFWGRPEAFYLVGGFAFQVVVDYLAGTVAITGSDEYDWHATMREEYDEESETYREVACWYTTPVPPRLSPLVAVAAKVFGSEYFVTNGWPMGEAGVSNKLWAALAQAGAKPFTTRISHTWTLQEWRSLAGISTRRHWGLEAGVQNWDEAPYRFAWMPEPEPVIEEVWPTSMQVAFEAAKERSRKLMELAESAW
jgi:hypothetical protein